jgi:hypothetical protein
MGLSHKYCNLKKGGEFEKRPKLRRSGKSLRLPIHVPVEAANANRYSLPACGKQA